MASPRWRQQLHHQTPSHRLPTFIIMFFLVVIIHTILTTRECGTSNTTDAAEKQDNCYYDTTSSQNQRVQIEGSDSHRPPQNAYNNTRTLYLTKTAIKPYVSGLRPQQLLHQSPHIIPSGLCVMSRVLIALIKYCTIVTSRENSAIAATGMQMPVRTMEGLQFSQRCIYCGSNCTPESVANGYECKHRNNSQRHSVPVMVRHHNCHLNLIYITAGVGINILIFIYTTTHTSSSMWFQSRCFSTMPHKLNYKNGLSAKQMAYNKQ